MIDLRTHSRAVARWTWAAYWAARAALERELSSREAIPPEKEQVMYVTPQMCVSVSLDHRQ